MHKLGTCIILSLLSFVWYPKSLSDLFFQVNLRISPYPVTPDYLLKTICLFVCSFVSTPPCCPGQEYTSYLINALNNRYANVSLCLPLPLEAPYLHFAKGGKWNPWTHRMLVNLPVVPLMWWLLSIAPLFWHEQWIHTSKLKKLPIKSSQPSIWSKIKLPHGTPFIT